MTNIQIRKKKIGKVDPTHLALMVNSISQEEIFHYDKSKIVDALINSIELSIDDANIVADEVTHKISGLNIKSIDTSFIRSMVNLVLFEKGFNKELSSRREFIVSHNDITNIVEHANKENGNMEHNPESINLTIAENVNKDYALKNVFSKDVVKAHLEGKLHIHDLGMAQRAYCSGHSIEYIKLNGIREIPNISSTSDPAGSAQTLARHVCSMTQFYTSLFAGAIGWEGVNIFFAPLLRNMNTVEMKQLAQTLIFDLSQLAGAKGGQTSFTDFNVYITIPEHYRETLAVFEHGKFACKKKETFLNKFSDDPEYRFFDTREETEAFAVANKNYYVTKYKHFEKESQIFLEQILSVIEKGDATGLPFAFPKINLHINEDSFTQYKFIPKKGYELSDSEGVLTYYTDREKMVEDLQKKENKLIPIRIKNEESQRLVKLASKASSKSGCPYFIFDRNAMSISQCCFSYDTIISFKDNDTNIVLTYEFSDAYDMYKDDVVSVFDGDMYEKAKIIKVFKNNRKMYKVILENDISFICTEDHLFPIEGKGDVCIRDIAHTDSFIFGNAKNYSKIKDIMLIENSDEYVYCFEMLNKSNPYFMLPSGVITHNCRLKIDFNDEDKKKVKTPEELRFVGVQNVSINLPNCALQYKDYDKFLKEIEHRMRLSMKAHLQKTKYLEHLVNLDNSPLKFYKKGMDGKPYVDLKRGSYLIGVVGLNECVYNLIGKQLHEDKEAFKKGLAIILFMNKLTKTLSEEFGITVKLEETPAESTASRFALLDLKKYPNAYVKRNEHGEYYSNSVHFAYDSNVDYIDRLVKQGMFHTLVEAGSMVHMWTGDKSPSEEAIYKLVGKTWYTTECTQWVLSPEYTTCYTCKKTIVGLYDNCPKCKSDNISQMSRITGYYVKLNKYNKGKKAELHDRNHEAYNI